MIDKQELTAVVEKALEGTDLFVVTVTVSRDNIIDVAIDSMDGNVSIDHCVMVNDAVLAAFDRDVEDYELTVGSYGISEPFMVREQWLKNVGGEVEVLTADGRKLRGTLVAVGNDNFTVAVTEKVKREGKKRPEAVEVEHTFAFSDVKYTKNIIKV